MAEKKVRKEEERLIELALLQLAADKEKELDSDYELQTLKNTLINKEIQTLLEAKLNGKEQQPAQPKLKEAIYQKAQKAAEAKVESAIRAYIAENEASLSREFVKRIVPSQS